MYSESQQDKKLFSSSECPAWPWGQPSLLFNGQWGYSLVIKWWCTQFTSHRNLMLMLRVSGAILVLPYMPSWHGHGQLYLLFWHQCYTFALYGNVQSEHNSLSKVAQMVMHDSYSRGCLLHVRQDSFSGQVFCGFPLSLQVSARTVPELVPDYFSFLSIHYSAIILISGRL